MSTQRSDTISALASALAEFQGEVENATKGSVNPAFRSKYADLAEILNTVRGPLSKHGLSITQHPSFGTGMVSVETLLLHKTGEWISSVISAPVGKQDAQGVGSAITYCRRYALASICGIAQEDDDANASIGKAPARDKVPTSPAKDAPQVPDTAPFDGETYEWSKSDREILEDLLGQGSDLLTKGKFDDTHIKRWEARYRGQLAQGDEPSKVFQRIGESIKQMQEKIA